MSVFSFRESPKTKGLPYCCHNSIALLQITSEDSSVMLFNSSKRSSGDVIFNIFLLRVVKMTTATKVRILKLPPKIKNKKILEKQVGVF